MPAFPLRALAAAPAALVTLTGCGLASGQVGPGGNYEAEQHVTITACSPGDIGSVEAVVRITNRDDQERTYFITAKAISEDGERFATLHGSAAAVGPGETVTTEAVALGFDAPAEFECELVSVDSVVR